MARGYGYYNRGGFADGFAGGFGLMNDFYESKRKQALAEEELESDREYQEGLLEDRRLTREGLEADRKTRRAIEKITADTAAVRAGTAAQEAKNKANKYNPDGSEKISAADQALIGLRERQKLTSKLQGDVAEETLSQAALESLNVKNANTLDALARTNDPDMIADIINNSPGLFDERSHLFLPDYFNPHREGAYAEFASELKGMAQGNNLEEASPAMLSAAHFLLKRNARDYIGKQLVSSSSAPPRGRSSSVADAFANAPKEWKDKGWTIEDAGIFDLKGSGGGNLNATAWLKVYDPQEQQHHFYQAPVTRNASTMSSGFEGIAVDDSIRSLVAQQGLANFLNKNPLIRDRTENALKAIKSGSVKEFDDRLDARVTLIMDAAKAFEADAMAGDSDDLFEESGVGNLTAGMVAANEDFVRRKVKETMLYGSSPQSSRDDAKQYFMSLDQDLEGVVGDSGSLSDMVDGGLESLSLNQKLSLNALLDSSEMDEEAQKRVTDYLGRIGKLLDKQKRKFRLR